MTVNIEDYGLIGDCETAALVSKDGSIDWLCWPRFDSGACFSALLGDAGNGRWRIAPAGAKPSITRRYRPNTLILETTFVTIDGEVMVIDFLPLRTQASHLVRLVVGKRGTVPMSTELIIRFDYGASVPWVRRTNDGDLLAVSGPDMLVLRTPIELRGGGAHDRGRILGLRRRDHSFRSHARAVPSSDSGSGRCARRFAANAGLLGGMGEHAPEHRPVRGRGLALAHHVEGPDICADRRHRGGADHIAAGADRRNAQLGLPLLLATRRHAHAARLHECRILRRSEVLA